jgi:hypothetical protein
LADGFAMKTWENRAQVADRSGCKLRIPRSLNRRDGCREIGVHSGKNKADEELATD